MELSLKASIIFVLLLFMYLQKSDSGQICSSCSGVDVQEDCTHHVTCNNNEKCYVHSYRSESGADLSDLGCTEPMACPSLFAQIIGRRAEGHHFKCMACCNETALCNQNLTCGGSISIDSSLPRECSDLLLTMPQNGSYIIFPYGVQTNPVSAYCEFSENEAWTVIQRRVDDSVDFDRSWGTYKNGFGNSNGNYWIGNDNIHAMTFHGHHELKVVLTDWSNDTRYALYTAFRIADEDHGYYISVWGYSGNAGDSLFYHDGMKFSTIDQNNDDSHGTSCAQYYKSAWWYKDCYWSNLNGHYYTSGSYILHQRIDDGIHWNTWHPSNYSLKTTTMMIRRN